MIQFLCRVYKYFPTMSYRGFITQQRRTSLTSKSRLTFVEGATLIEAAVYPKFTTFLAYPTVPEGWKDELYPVAGHTSARYLSDKLLEPFEAKKQSAATGDRFSSTEKVNSVHWEEWVRRVKQPGKMIHMNNVLVKSEAVGASYTMTKPDLQPKLYSKPSFTGTPDADGY